MGDPAPLRALSRERRSGEPGSSWPVTVTYGVTVAPGAIRNQVTIHAVGGSTVLTRAVTILVGGQSIYLPTVQR